MHEIKRAGNKISTRLIETRAPYISYLELEKIPFIKNAFSTRIGGVSGGMYESMNFSVKMGDDEENVIENFGIFCGENGLNNPVMTDQTHTTNVKKITRDDIGKNIYRPKDYSDIDGFITNEPDITLVTTFADCVPLYFVDTRNKAIGLAHSGWKGTVGRIGKEVVQNMNREYGTNPEDIVAAIGPSICVNCYEVSCDVAEKFMDEFLCGYVNYPDDNMDMLNSILPQNTENILYKKDEEHYMLNLWAANYKVLKEAGIRDENISLPDICTCCNKNLLFSHRGHKGKRGNLCAFLTMIN